MSFSTVEPFESELELIMQTIGCSSLSSTTNCTESSQSHQLNCSTPRSTSSATSATSDVRPQIDNQGGTKNLIRQPSKTAKPSGTYAAPTSSSRRKSRQSLTRTGSLLSQGSNARSKNARLSLSNYTSVNIRNNTQTFKNEPSSIHTTNRSQRPTSPAALRRQSSIIPPVPPLPQQLTNRRARLLPQTAGAQSRSVTLSSFPPQDTIPFDQRNVRKTARYPSSQHPNGVTPQLPMPRKVSGVQGPRTPPPSITALSASSAPHSPLPHGTLPRSATTDDFSRHAQVLGDESRRLSGTHDSVPGNGMIKMKSSSPVPIRQGYNGAYSPYRQRTRRMSTLDSDFHNRQDSPYTVAERSYDASEEVSSIHSRGDGFKTSSSTSRLWIPTAAGSGTNLPNIASNSNLVQSSMPSAVATASSRMISRNIRSSVNLKSMNVAGKPYVQDHGVRQISSLRTSNSSSPVPSTAFWTDKATLPVARPPRKFANLKNIVPEEELSKVREIWKTMITTKDQQQSVTKQLRNLKLVAGNHVGSKKSATDGCAVAPMTPAVATKTYRLNMYEKGEILDYRKIYFCGLNDAKKINGDLRKVTNNNYGFDDDDGNYLSTPGDHLAYRYEIVSQLGMGSFGKVLKCVDHKTGKLVAVKMIINRRKFHLQALVEADFCKFLTERNRTDYGGNLPILDYVERFTFRNHLCIATELLGMNLYELLKINKFKGFEMPLVRSFTKQILEALAFLDSKHIIHCDLKPENVLVSDLNNAKIKLIDFGSSCYEHERVYTYIQSRFYRSPEVILGISYNTKIDIWSLGCLVPEMATAKALLPGTTESEQIALTIQMFGAPSYNVVERCSRRRLFFDSLGVPLNRITQIAEPGTKSLEKHVFKGKQDEVIIDFVTRLLEWDPDQRLTAVEALQHDFITKTPA